MSTENITVHPNIGKFKNTGENSVNVTLSNGAVPGSGAFTPYFHNEHPMVSVASALYVFNNNNIVEYADIQTLSRNKKSYPRVFANSIVSACTDNASNAPSISDNSTSVYVLDSTYALYSLDLATMKSTHLIVGGTIGEVSTIVCDGTYVWALTSAGSIAYCDPARTKPVWSSPVVPTTTNSQTIDVTAVTAINGCLYIAGNVGDVGSVYSANTSSLTDLVALTTESGATIGISTTVTSMGTIFKNHFSSPGYFNQYLYLLSEDPNDASNTLVQVLYFANTNAGTEDEEILILDQNTGPDISNFSSGLCTGVDGRLYYFNPENTICWVDPAINFPLLLSTSSYNSQTVLPNYNFELTAYTGDASYDTAAKLTVLEGEATYTGYLFYEDQEYDETGSESLYVFDKTIVYSETTDQSPTAVSLEYFPQDGSEGDVAIRPNLNAGGGVMITEVIIDPISEK